MSMLRAAVLSMGILSLPDNVLAEALESGPEAARPATQVALRIDAQPLTAALNQWAEQTGVMVMVSAEGEAGTRIAPTVNGEYTPEKALSLLLAGSGLSYQFVAERTVAVSEPRTQELKGSDPADTGRAELNVEEVVVTAEKREERLRDVPIPVFVVDADRLAENGRVLLRDYSAMIPGLSVTVGGNREQALTIRGLSRNGSHPTVGFLVDDVPVGASTAQTAGGYVPDIDPGDLERIEVLRGPQGTLYGSSSLGGLIKYVTREPDIDAFSGRVQAGMYAVKGSADPGHDIRVSTNVPLSATLAMRASAFTRTEPGFIDNPVYSLKDVNEVDTSGARLAALWRPSEAFSLQLNGIHQQSDADGLFDIVVAPGLGDLQQNYIPQAGRAKTRFDSFSAVLKAAVGRADLTSVTAFSEMQVDSRLDFTYAFGGPAMSLFNAPAALYQIDSPLEKVTHETRMTLPLGSHFEWLVGGFYAKEESSLADIRVDAIVPATGELQGQLFRNISPRESRSIAAFTTLTYRPTDRFDVQLGVRQSRERAEYSGVRPGPLSAGIDLLTRSNTEPFTYLLAPRFRISRDTMLYARIASGFRPGGANVIINPGTPASFEEDLTKNYELGLKTSLFGRRLYLDAAIYRIDWDDIQLRVSNGVTTFFQNGGKARSEGIELSFETYPLQGLSFKGWVAYNDAVLTEPLPPQSTVRAAAGARLPESARKSAYLAISQDFYLRDDVKLSLGADVSYLGDRLGNFTASGARRFEFPGYRSFGLNAGVGFREWTVSAYANNLSDERPVVGQSFQPSTFYVITPRTLGLSIVRQF
jgi:iron complex outermembrane recepter protein